MPRDTKTSGSDGQAHRNFFAGDVPREPAIDAKIGASDGQDQADHQTESQAKGITALRKLAPPSPAGSGEESFLHPALVLCPVVSRHTIQLSLCLLRCYSGLEATEGKPLAVAAGRLVRCSLRSTPASCSVSKIGGVNSLSGACEIRWSHAYDGEKAMGSRLYFLMEHPTSKIAAEATLSNQAP